MFWRSVVGKLAMTILLLVSFVLFILTILLLEFFENFHVQEAEKVLMRSAAEVSVMLEHYEDRELIVESTESINDPRSRVAVVTRDGDIWTSGTQNKDLAVITDEVFREDSDIVSVFTDRENVNKQMSIPDENLEVMIVGMPTKSDDEAVFVYQSLDVIDETKAETTRIIFIAAGIAIVLTTFFAFFLSTRITAPLIKMREAALDLTRGEFNTKVPILTHDEIGELATAFNKMGKQLNFHINALRQEKEQLSSIVASMADGVMTLNRKGEMIITNPPAEQFLDDWYFEHNLPMTNSERALPEPLHNILQRIINGEEEVLQEISLQGRNWVMIMTPLYDQSYVRGAVAVIRDMTEERRLDKLRKDFIANVTHELRTPISFLQGYSEAIVYDIAESKEDKNELAQIIHDESVRLSRLVNELLDIRRMEAGHIELHKEEAEILPFVEKIYRKFTGISDEQKIKLDLIKDIDNPIAIFDVNSMEEVLTNLIDNAISHTEENGSITVKSTNQEVN